MSPRTPAAFRPPEPSEETEQICLFRWADLQSGKYPELANMYHIPNGGKRSKAEAARFKAAGVRAGVPDIHLPTARQCPHPVYPMAGHKLYYGLYIELKREHGGRVSAAQEEFIMALRRESYAVEVCHGWEAAKQVIIDYLEGRYMPLYKP